MKWEHAKYSVANGTVKISYAMYLVNMFLIVVTSFTPLCSPITTDATYSLCTDVEKEHVTYNWTIKNINLLINGPQIDLVSPPFHTRNHSDKWRLEFYPKGWKSDDDEYASVFLQLLSTEKLNINAHWKITIITSNTSIGNDDEIHTFSQLGGYGNIFFVRGSDLLRGDDDEITIRCELDLIFGIIEVPCEKQDIPEELATNLEKNRLVDDFRMLFESMKSSDVSIVVDEQTFPAHKVILMTRSPIFAELLEQQENEEDPAYVLTIDNMTPTEVRAMLEFIYTDNVTNLSELAHGLLAAADKFKLQRLKAMCDEVLYRKLNIERAADTLILSHLYHSDELKRFSLLFIAEHLADVSLTEGYKKMTEMYPELLTEIVQSIVPKISEPYSG